MTRLPLLCLVAGICVVFATYPVASQMVPVAPLPKQPAEPEEGKAKKTATGRVLNTESLSEMLDSMGYDFQTQKLPSGHVLYTVTIPSDTWKFVLEVSLAPNGSLVWLIAPLQPLPAAGAVPSEQLVRLMQENWPIYPHTFAIPKDSRRLYLQRAFENQNVTPAKLRGAIDSMTGTIRNTAPLWNVSKWGETTTPEGKKDTGTVAAYPDTPEGLTKLSKEILALAKAGKRPELTAKVKELVVPNHDAWFKRVFGPAVGAALAEEYTLGLQQSEASLIRLFMTAAEEGQTEVKVVKFTKPEPDHATGNQNKALEAMVVKTPLYSVFLTQPGEETGMQLYSFVYVDGNFRLAGKMRGINARTVGFRGLNGFDLLNSPVPAVPAAPNHIVGSQPEVSPNVRAVSAPLGNGLIPLGFAPPTTEEPKDDEPSIVGVWQGELNLANQKWKVTTTLRANGTFKSVMEYGGHVLADKGTYKYADGILTTEPEGGLTGTFTVTFVGNDTIKVKGGGYSISYKRQ